MPTISVFFGIIIRMFYRDHNPPNFHAEHQGQHAKFDLDGKLLDGELILERLRISSGSGRVSINRS